jgi:hypothetical protein
MQKLIHANYTLDSGKQMFEGLFQGKSIEEIMPSATESSNDCDTELF